MNVDNEQVKCIVDREQYLTLMDRLPADDIPGEPQACYKYCYCPDCGCNQAYGNY